MTVAQIIGEALCAHQNIRGKDKKERIDNILKKVGLDTEQGSRYPHEFSGGQRQRIGIARALAVEPEFIVADEPVSALDVSIQSQIINLLCDLRQEMGLTMLFISHDLRVIRHIADRVAVMYLGKIVEESPVETLFNRPLHPYTRALLSAVPVPDPEKKRTRIILSGDVPDPGNPPTGCPFHPRCPEVMDICGKTAVSLYSIEAGHTVACLRYKNRE
jgi:oligopeptide/dipeptide ABC transporter ATP-binding protein